MVWREQGLRGWHLSCMMTGCTFDVFFFFQAEDGIRDVAVTGVQTCALPISFTFGLNNVFGQVAPGEYEVAGLPPGELTLVLVASKASEWTSRSIEVDSRVGTIDAAELDRKSTRLNSSHGYISYAVFCLKKI